MWSDGSLKVNSKTTTGVKENSAETKYITVVETEKE
jgi:hypothetical protein